MSSSNLFFLDFEASSLDSGSFPIEIAWVEATGQGEHYLIKPHWKWKGWSAQSQAIHGIRREQLDTDGISPLVVATRVWEALGGQLVCSDNPAFDGYWLGMLLEVAGLSPLPVVELDAVIGHEIRRMLSLIKVESNTPKWHCAARKLLDEGQAYAGLQCEIGAMRKRVSHRALPDAEGMWSYWHEVKEWVDKRLLAEHAKSQ